jgi:E3 ubiquitin-protein ligase UBR4
MSSNSAELATESTTLTASSALNILNPLRPRVEELLSRSSSSSSNSTNNLNDNLNGGSNTASSQSNTTPQSDKKTDSSSPNKENQKSSSIYSSFKYDLKSKWLKLCLFSKHSKSVRQLTSNLIQSIFTFYSQLPQQNVLVNLIEHEYSNYNSRKFQLAELVCELLDECNSQGGETCSEFTQLFKHIILSDKDCKYRLVLRLNILHKLESALLKEIKIVSDLERISEFSYLSTNSNLLQTTSTNLTLGFSIKMLTDFMSIFLKEQNIKNKFKSRLIASILNSYLSLKKLIFQRTKDIDEAQEKLLNCLEQMTSGTEQETRKFMSICIETVNNFELDDLVTPVFIFERLCNIIYPEETVDNKEFLIILEKDPNQEDYLQGRMLGNPYSSNDPGLGPLMRNIKNKICVDSELIALLEDDNGMELLVNNKIISLDLPVKDVYKKVNL